jgi:hypothetical protein
LVRGALPLRESPRTMHFIRCDRERRRAGFVCLSLTYAGTRMRFGLFTQMTPSGFVNSLGGAFEYRDADCLSPAEVQAITDECQSRGEGKAKAGRRGGGGAHVGGGNCSATAADAGGDG